VFDDRLLRRIFVPRGRKEEEAEEKWILKGFTTYTLHQTLLE
jgi:hypothetical protein